jgi:hypothetical protein
VLFNIKSPPLKIGNGLLKTKGKIEVIIRSENLSGVYYKDWQAIGQVGPDIARLESPTYLEQWNIAVLHLSIIPIARP